MSVRDFLGFANIKEVQCTGGNFKTNVNYLSLTLFNVSDLQVLVSFDSSDNACYTFSQYSACNVVEGDRRKSVIRTLVARLKPSDSVMVGCNVTSFRRDHLPEVYSWSVVVKMNRKYHHVMNLAVSIGLLDRIRRACLDKKHCLAFVH